MGDYRRKKMKTVTVETYKSDKYYSNIVKATAAILSERDEIRPIDVFIKMSLLSIEDLEKWHSGKIPYLEKAIKCNLSKAARILRILRMHAHDLDMDPRVVDYWKNNSKKATLRFSKMNNAKVEEAYKRHFLIVGSRDRFIERNREIMTFYSE